MRPPPLLKDRLGLGQLGGGVGAHDGGFGGVVGPDLPPFRRGDGDYVGQVVLALGVGVGDPREPVEQAGPVGAEHAGVTGPHHQLSRRGVAGLDDAPHLAFGAGEDAPVQQGVGRLEAQQGQVRPLRPQAEQGVQVLRRQKRAVAIDHQDVALEVRKGRSGGQDGVAGAERRVLDRRRPGAETGLDQLAHGGAVGPDHHHDTFTARLQDGVDHPVQQGASPDLVQDLGDGGLHPGPLPGGEDDGGAGGHGGNPGIVGEMAIMAALAETASRVPAPNGPLHRSVHAV